LVGIRVLTGSFVVFFGATMRLQTEKGEGRPMPTGTILAVEAARGSPRSPIHNPQTGSQTTAML
jgi:hypothetical protein